jgi:uncharacterized protein (DUF885 family)
MSAQRSDAFAQHVIDACVEFSPEEMSLWGIVAADERISQISVEFEDAALAAFRSVRAALAAALASETDAGVKRDLEILLAYLDNRIAGIEIDRRLEVPYVDVPGLLFGSLQPLLDVQAAPARRTAALIRLRKYAGLEPGFTPAGEAAAALTRERLNDAALAPPPRRQVERDLAVAAHYLPGIRDAFAEAGVDADAELKVLEAQFEAYAAFVRDEVLPRARHDFKVPAEKYAHLLRTYGNEQAPEQLAAEARQAFPRLQAEADALAAQIARDRGYPSEAYRDVAAQLVNEQLPENRILECYVARNAEIEAIIRRESIVELPDRELSIRYATSAESAAVPSPYFQPATIVGNTGERGTFVLPRTIPGEDGEALPMHDDSSVGMTWPLSAHEARPGHELQFSSLATGAVSLARKLFAFNSVNVEGWGLYSEWLIEPFMPPEGRLATLTMRMMRTARAFLDPELQLGRISPEEAREILENEVAVSAGLAFSEVQRYTFISPGQAPSYYYGYVRLRALRDDVERELGQAFDQKSFHDFILAQGMVSPRLLRDAVFSEYVPARRNVV